MFIWDPNSYANQVYIIIYTVSIIDVINEKYWFLYLGTKYTFHTFKEKISWKKKVTIEK